ncbi:rod shape-determining protein MreC [Bacteroidota bacterium]
MKVKLKKLFSSFREYLILIILLLISLSVLPLNTNSNIKHLKAYAFGSFAYLGSFLNSVTSILLGNDELLELKKLNSEMMLELNNLRVYALENDELKNLLNFKDTSDYELIPAQVISRNVSFTQGNFVVNSGIDDSVKIGMPVINETGLIGIVKNVSQNYAFVRTLNNNLLKIAVENQRSRIHGMLNWDGEQLVIKNLPSTADIQIGDRIITSEFSTIIPPLIPVGIITAKESTISGLLGKVIVKPYVNPNAVKQVFIYKVFKDPELQFFELKE